MTRKLPQLGLAVTSGFGLGAAYVGFGFQAGLLFWFVILLSLVVKVVVVNTWTQKRHDIKAWETLLAQRPRESAVTRLRRPRP